MEQFDIAIVGGGIVGAATFYKIIKQRPELKVVLIEKEEELADHQTGHNSGVIHSGLYYTPGSKKAINCVKGRKELVQFCKQYGVAHDVCGKVVVATDAKELPHLDKIFEIGKKNGIEGIRKITGEEIKEYEPHCEGIAGIHVPVTGIVDYRGATKKMVEIGKELSPHSEVKIGEAVTHTVYNGEFTTIKTSKGKYSSKYVVFCAGLQADRLARQDGVNLKERVVGFRGDYYVLTEQAVHKVKNLIYPVPNPDFPFLGVHFTRMTNGEVECGPNAVFTFKREGYGKTDFSLRDTYEALTYGGTWKLFFKNFKFGLNEYSRAFSKRLFLKTLQRLVPSLTMDDIKPGRAGVRALLLREDGDTKDDFRIEYTENSVHVLNAPSPAATAALAIGDDVSEMVFQKFKL